MQKLVLDENGNEVVKQAASAGKLVLDENGNEVVKADAYQSIPNPTGQPLGARIPSLPQGDYDPSHAISVSGLGPSPTFLKEAAGNAGQMVKDVATDPRTWFTAAARRFPTVAAGMGGGEAVRQIGQHISGSPEAPQTSGEAAKRIATSVGIGVGALGAFKGAGKVDSLLAQRAERKLAQSNLEKELLAVQEAGREKKLVLDVQARQEKAAQDQMKRQALLMERQATHQELITTRQSSEEAKALMQQEMAITARMEGPKFGPKTDFVAATGGLIAKRKGAMGGRVSELYTEFESFPEARQPFESIDLKQMAAEISANSTPMSMPPIVAKTMALPDEVPLHVAESLLSDLKSAARHAGIFANKNQYVSGRVAEKLDNQITELIGSTEGGAMALNYLKAGRALHKLKIMTFQGGDRHQIPKKVADKLATYVDPIFIAANPQRLQAFVKQAGPEGLPILKRELWDTTVEKSVNPQTGELNIDAFSKRFNKFRHIFSEQERIAGDQLARGDHEVLANVERATRANVYEIRMASQELKNVVANDHQLSQMALQSGKQRAKLTVDQGSRAKRLDMSLEEKKVGFSAPIKALIFWAQVAIGGASIVQARSMALRAMFGNLSKMK